MGAKIKQHIPLLFAFLFAAVCVLMLFFPLPREAGAAFETYPCVWDDGTTTEESYRSAYSALAGIAEDGSVELICGDRIGHIAPTSALLRVRTVLEGDSLPDLLNLSTEGLSRLERAALFQTYGNTVYYAGEAFRFTGETVSRSADKVAETLVLLSGALPPNYLCQIGATHLKLTHGAEFLEDMLLGSRIFSVTAQTPYSAQQGAIFYDIVGERRLIGALPLLETLTLAESDFADAGALAACTQLHSLTLPYIGTARSGGGELAVLFIRDRAYRVPETLKTVKVTGGTLVSWAFIACTMVEEIDACGVDPAQIARDAFLGADNLKNLHTPRADVVLPANFDAAVAPCGCYVYTRR